MRARAASTVRGFWRVARGAHPVSAPRLQGMYDDLREQRDLAKRLQEETKGVEEDDLRWLLDKEEGGGNLMVGAAREEKEELASQAEFVTKVRIAAAAFL